MITPDERAWSRQLEDENKRLREVIQRLQQDLRELHARLSSQPVPIQLVHTTAPSTGVPITHE